MKKGISVGIGLLFALTILYLVGFTIADSLGYCFELLDTSVFSAAVTVLSVCVVILDRVYQKLIENRVVQVFCAIITPLYLISAVFYIVNCPTFWVIAGVLVSAGCCCYLALRHGRPVLLKVIALALTVPMAMGIAFFSFLALLFGGLGQTTVVQTVPSPSGKYYAQVIDSDQGALGGDTFVDVYTKSYKKPQRVYQGEWGAFKHMQIYWKNEHCLVINSVEYEIE